MSGDFNEKHTDGISQPIMVRDALLRDYAHKNACLIYGPDSPTSVPYQQNTNPHVLDGLCQGLRLTSASVYPAFRSDHLHVLIDTTCRTSFQHLLHRLYFKGAEWVAYQACFEDRLPGSPVLNGVLTSCLAPFRRPCGVFY
jgi:hypothetical protein